MLFRSPTGNLDTHTTFEMMNLMTRLAGERKQTLVIVTHDMEISSYATRLIKIRDGKIESIVHQEGHGPIEHTVIDAEGTAADIVSKETASAEEVVLKEPASAEE